MKNGLRTHSGHHHVLDARCHGPQVGTSKAMVVLYVEHMKFSRAAFVQAMSSSPRCQQAGSILAGIKREYAAALWQVQA